MSDRKRISPKQSYSPDDLYPIRLDEDGYCGNAIIFVMHEFKGNDKRKGALEESKNLQLFAKKLKLKPHLFLNATKRQIHDTLDFVTRPPKTRPPNIPDDIWNARLVPTHDAVLVAVSSHGNSSYFLTSDDYQLLDGEIEYYLNEKRCALLSGKPKFLFFNKCRANDGDVYETYLPSSARSREVESGECVLKDSDTGGPNRDSSGVSSSNFIRVYSCSDGTSSFRSPDYGSLIISALPEAYESYGQGRDIEMFFRQFRSKMLEEINKKVRATEGLSHTTQCVSTEKNTLTKRLIFPEFQSDRESCEEMEVQHCQERNMEENDDDMRNFDKDDSRKNSQEKRKSKNDKSGFFHRKCKYKEAHHTPRPRGQRVRRKFFSIFV